MRYTSLQAGDLIFIHDEPEAWVYIRNDGHHHVKAFSLQGGQKVQRSIGTARIRRGTWSFAGPVRK